MAFVHGVLFLEYKQWLHRRKHISFLTSLFHFQFGEICHGLLCKKYEMNKNVQTSFLYGAMVKFDNTVVIG